jgi:teichuronic acid biosynthesis glycosyltransferase TuaH
MPARTAPRARRGRDGLIVVCAVASYDGIRMSDWHLAQHLSKLAPVLYVDPPSFRHPAARGPRRTDRLRQEGPGLARLVPMVPPFPARPAVAGTTAALIRRDLRWATARLGGQVSAVLSGWPQFPVFGACGERVRAYWAKDDFVAGAALFGLNAAMLQRRERQVAAAADLLIAANPAVAAMWRSSGRDPLLIPFGTDAAAYLGTDRAPLPPGVSLPPPVAGFIGRLNARTDLALLEAIAARGRSLLLVGPKDPGCDQRRFAALQDRPNVHWAGQQPAAALPGYLRLMDVGLVPYTPSRFNLGSFPLKVLEYLAAGRPVAATDLPALRALDTDLIHLTGPASFADQVDHLLTQPRTPQLAARCQAFAAQHTWAQRATDIHHALTSYPPPPARLPSAPKSSVRAMAATRSGPVDQ